MSRSPDQPIAVRHRSIRRAAAALVLASGSIVAAQSSADDQGALHALAQRWLEAQEREDLDGFLALYSPDAAGAERRREYTAVIFQSGDDRFSNVRIDRATVAGDRGTVRVIADRARTIASSQDTLSSRLAIVLECRRTTEGWRLFDETSPALALADQLIAETDPAAGPGGEARIDALLDAEREIVGQELLRAVAQRADRFAFGGDFARARPAYQLVASLARRLEDDDTVSRALQNIGNAYYFRGDYTRALEQYRERLALEEKRGGQPEIAVALQAVATAHYSLADYVSALDAYRSALAIEEAVENDAGIAALLTSIGNVYFLQGDFVGALDAYARSRRAFDTLTLERVTRALGTAGAWHGEGRTETLRGNYGAAAAALQTAVARFREARAESGVAAALSSLAHVKHLRGDDDGARALYLDSLGIEQARRNAAGVARVMLAIGFVELVRGRFQDAADAYSCSRDEFEKQKPRDREGRAYATLGLGFAQTGLEKIDEALASYTTASAEFEALGRREQVGRAALGMALAHAARRAARESLDAARRAAAVAREVGSRDLEWRARVREGYALLALERLEDARRAFEAGAAIVEAAVDLATEEPADPTNDDRGTPYVGLAETFVAIGDDRAALAAAEGARLRRLRDELARVRDAIRAGMTDAERDEERRLVREVVSLGAQVARESRLPKPDAARLSDLRGRRARAVAERDAFTARLYERLPDLRRWRGDLAQAEIDAASAPVPAPREAIVSFVVSEDRVLAFVAGRGSADVSALAVPGTARTLLDKPEAIVATLRSTLPAPSAAPDAPAGRPALVIIPDGFVWRVPFESLMPEFAVTYAGSLLLLERVRASASAPDAPPSPQGSGELTGAATIDAASPFYSMVALDGRDPMELRELFTAPIAARQVRLAEPADGESPAARFERAAHALQWAFAAAGVPSVMIGRLVLAAPAAPR